MKSSLIICLLLLFSFLLPSLAETDPDEPIEFIDSPPTNKIAVVIHPEIVYDDASDRFEYKYRLQSLPESEQNVCRFDFDVARELDLAGPGPEATIEERVQALIGLIEAPSNTRFWNGAPETDLPNGYNILLFAPFGEPHTIPPGESLDGFRVISEGPPGISTARLKGDVPPPTGQQIELRRSPEVQVWPFNCVQVKIPAPHAVTNSAIPVEFASFIADQTLKASELNWLPPEFHSSVLQIHGHLSSSNASAAIELTLSTLSTLSEQRGFGVSDNGYFLLRPNLERLLTLLGVTPPPPPSLSVTLPAERDSIIRAQKPHRNEGANPLLMLSHRPDIRNKSNNPIVGFDFTDINLNGLTKATLVLNIQECDIPKRWGKKGRRIEAHPVNEPWVEGNGKHLKVQGQKTRGDGQGVTWFSPVDDDISNKAPDGTLQWMGARPYLGPVTAPPVRVKNRQTGPVEFDVTADVQTGFRDGWLLRKKNEAKFGNIRFYSKEGAAEAGNPDLAPRLILEYGGSSADAGTNAGQSVTSSGRNYLKAVTRTTEGTTIKEVLQENATVAYTGQLLLTLPLNKAPVAQAAVRTAYRSWLNDSLTLANLVQSLA